MILSTVLKAQKTNEQNFIFTFLNLKNYNKKRHISTKHIAFLKKL